VKHKSWIRRNDGRITLLVTLAIAVAVGVVVVNAMCRAYTEDQVGVVGVDSVKQVGENEWSIFIHGSGGGIYTYRGELPEWVTGMMGGQFVLAEYNMGNETIIRFIEPAEAPGDYFPFPLTLLAILGLLGSAALILHFITVKKRGSRRG